MSNREWALMVLLGLAVIAACAAFLWVINHLVIMQ